MALSDSSSPSTPLPPIFIVSGGAGASGEQLVHTVLAQFPEVRMKVVTLGNVRFTEQVEAAVEQAAAANGLIVHTLVDSALRDQLLQAAARRGLTAVDLMGPLITFVSQVTGQLPLGQPGRYRLLHQDYFRRVSAIEYSMAHDDGQDAQAWNSADIVLAGVSRSGKTPLSMYLSVLGWKAANTPLVPGIDPPPQLFEIPPHRVIGLDIEPGQLVAYRRQRQARLGAPGPSAYTDPRSVYEEVEYARQLFRRGGFSSIDVTDKPIESSADEVIRLITRHFEAPSTLPAEF